MKKLDIFDPALCCSSGVCGTEVDEELVTFSADADWFKKQGGQLNRYNLSQQPMVFIDNAVVNAFLQRAGEQCLPLVLLGGEIVLAGRYPTRSDLARWLATDTAAAPSDSEEQSSCCCSDGCC